MYSTEIIILPEHIKRFFTRTFTSILAFLKALSLKPKAHFIMHFRKMSGPKMMHLLKPYDLSLRMGISKYYLATKRTEKMSILGKASPVHDLLTPQ